MSDIDKQSAVTGGAYSLQDANAKPFSKLDTVIFNFFFPLYNSV